MAAGPGQHHCMRRPPRRPTRVASAPTCTRCRRTPGACCAHQLPAATTVAPSERERERIFKKKDSLPERGRIFKKPVYTPMRCVHLPSYCQAIPQRFTEYFIEECSSWVTILSPLGKAWHVNIHGDNKNLYFTEGWDKFVAAHKLSVGDLLVFKYTGGLVFDVSIFDQSTCERDYNIQNETGSDKVSGRGKNCERNFERFKEQTTSSCSKRTATMMEQASFKHEPDVLHEHVVQMHYKAQVATKECRRRPYFMLTIQPCHKYSLKIPTSFGESNDLSSIHQLFLRDPKGHMWPTKLVHRHYASHKSSFLSTGWRDFRVGNSLEDGDVCIFELIEEKNEMHVQIRTRGSLNSTEISQDDNRRLKRPFYEKTSEKLDKGSRSIDASAKFTSIIVPTNVSGSAYLNIPKSFLSSVDFSGVHEVILVDPTSRQWPVSIRRRDNSKSGRKRVWMGCGWQAFRDANHVRVGDLCTFSFKSGMQKATFQVDVVKSEADAP